MEVVLASHGTGTLILFGVPLGPLRANSRDHRLVEGTRGREIPQASCTSLHLAGSLSWHP